MKRGNQTFYTNNNCSLVFTLHNNILQMENGNLMVYHYSTTRTGKWKILLKQCNNQ